MTPEAESLKSGAAVSADATVPSVPRSSMGMGKASYQVIVVLPAYNEEANIGGLLDSIAEHLNDNAVPYQVVVVDDGSRDRTAEILEEYARGQPLHVYRHPTNQGLGATIRDGLFYAAQLAGDKDIVVTMDADETHPPGLMLRMIGAIREGRDVVIASRYQRGAVVYGLTAHRRLISLLSSWFMRALFPTQGVRDYTCGYRAYRGAALKAAIKKYGSGLVDQAGFQCMVDILLKFRRMRVIFGEVPMILRYDFKKGASKMRLFHTAYRTLRLVFLRRIGQ